MLRGQVKRLGEHSERLRTNDLELKEARRHAAEGALSIEKVREMWEGKLALEQRDFELGRQEHAERVERYEKRHAADALRIRALEEEVASLKAAAARGSESLSALLARLDLSAHLSVLEDEELDVALLRSMGRDELASNMAQLGLKADEIARLATALLPVDVS